ncbi:Centromere-associated protein E [Galdieria sulphuraria]|nr:Centromere-associated protein E [Galdieria sulphuraria]
MEVFPCLEREGRSSSSPSDNNHNSTSKTDTLKVYVRVRPLNVREREVCHAGKPLTYCSYAFDRIFTPEDNNKIVFEEAASSVVDSTHTMLGTPEDKGIIPLSIYQVFGRLERIEDREFLLRVSYIEIYNENIRDLLAPHNENLKVHEDFNGRVFVDAKEEVVDTPETVLEIMKKGESNRTIGSTNMNEHSSRSHTIFTVFIESREKNRDIESDGLSVRASAEGSRLKEGMHINKSLLTLGTVINKLCEGVNSHIPYRDSKLTRILQPALGGNSKTTVICAVTPAAMHIEETHSTLKFASRAKKVKINAYCNEILDDKAMLSNYRKEIEMLRNQLTELQQDRQGGEKSLPYESGQEIIRENVDCEPTLSEIDFSAPRKRMYDGYINDEHLSKLQKLSTHHCVISTESPRKRTVVSFVHASFDTFDYMESYLVSLENTLKEEENEIQCLKSQLMQVTNNNELLEMENASYRKRYTELYSQHCFRVSQDVVTDLMNNVVQNELERCSELKCKQWEQHNRKQDEKLFELFQQKEELENRINALEADLSKKTSQLETYHTAMLPNGNQSILKENDSLKQKVTELESKCRSSKVLCSQATSEKQQLERELKVLQKQLRKLEAENVKLKESSSKQKENSSQVNNLENKLEDLTKDREKTMEELQTLEKEKNEFMLENKTLLMKLEEARERVENFRSDLEQSREESSKVAAQNELLQQENEQMRHQIVSLNDNLEEISAIKKSLSRNVEELEQRVHVLESSYNELQSRREEEQREFEEERNSNYEQLTEAHLQLEQSKVAIEQLQASLSDEQKKSQSYYSELEEVREKYVEDTEHWKELSEHKDSEFERISVLYSELLTSLESVDSERRQLERDVNDCSHTILLIKERLELVWKEKQQLSMELDLSKELRDNYKPICKTSIPSLSINPSTVISLLPVEGDDPNSLWKQEFEKTNQELAKFYKEKKKLLETIHQRDQKIEQLENSYRNLVEDNGVIELRKVEELAVAACKGSGFEDGRQLVRLQADNHALQDQVTSLNRQIENLQNERQQLLEESSRLRKEIKKRDLHRIELEEKFCLWKQQLYQDDQNGRTKRKPPRPPLRVIPNETQ